MGFLRFLNFDSLLRLESSALAFSHLLSDLPATRLGAGPSADGWGNGKVPLGVGNTLPFTEVFTQCSGFLPGLHTEITHGVLQIPLFGLQSWRCWKVARAVGVLESFG